MSGSRFSKTIARLGVLVALVLGATFASDVACAQSPADLKKARAQFQRGIELEQASNWTEAIQQFREVGQVRMTPQVRFHIAYCEEGLGRLVTALGGYDLAMSEADSVGPDFKNEVETAISRLRERIPKLFIERGAGADAALVQLDGVDIGGNSIGVEVPLDPGPHKVTAAAPGYKPFDATVELKEREVTKVTLELEVLPKEVAPPPPTRVVIVPQEKGPDRTVPYVIGGAGIVFLGVGGALFALKQTTLADLEKDCPDKNACPESNKDSYDKAKLYGVLAPISAGVGVAAIGTAVTMILLEKKPEKKAKAKESSVGIDLVVPAVSENRTVGGSVVGHF